MKTLIVYYSWTGAVEKMAEQIRLHLKPFSEIVEERIVPVQEHGYWGWLMRSFLPGWRVPIRPAGTETGAYDLVCLGFPKWTLSCPPVSQYVAAMRWPSGQKFGLFMSYGGFDGERYLKDMMKRVARKGARIVAAAPIRRGAVRDGSFKDAMERFCRELLAGG